MKNIMNIITNNKKIIIRSIIVFLIFTYSFYLKLIPIKVFNLDINNISTEMNVLLSTFSSILLVFIFFFIYRKDLIKEFHIFKKNLANNLDIGLRYWFLGLVIMVVSNLIISYFFNSNGAENENIVQSFIKYLPGIMLINAGLLAPFNEEIVFRKTLYDVFKNKWVFAFFSFLFFGGAHVLGGTTLVDYLYIIPYGALGGAFALAYYETKSIFTSMSFHMFHNITLVLVSILFI